VSTRSELYTATGQLLEVTVNNGDGTGTRTAYDGAGNVTGTQNLVNLPIPPTPAPDPVAVLQAQVDQLTATLNALLGG